MSCYKPGLRLKPHFLIHGRRQSAGIKGRRRSFCYRFDPWRLSSRTFLSSTAPFSRPFSTTAHAYNPRSSVWLKIDQPPINHVLALRSSHSTLLYMQSSLQFCTAPTPCSFGKQTRLLRWRATASLSPKVSATLPLCVSLSSINGF
ncbi:hypothetical protein CIPAW_11G008800 [Carya illinoinensis]|uniref:Uncharacterized protein n=1 Tax=Carya illinoinensis TaxID=32201 RepID=A0A8T1P208_CARIL|nr:hypothetical protein CIPAW_11G008800 [Carya illinoinensis]